jgi:hypothetical protein
MAARSVVSGRRNESRGWRRLGTKKGAEFDDGVQRADEIIQGTRRTHRVIVVIGCMIAAAIIGGVVWLLVALF